MTYLINKTLKVFSILILLFFASTSYVFADNYTAEGKVIEIKEEGTEQIENNKVDYQILTVEITTGTEHGKYVEIKNGGISGGVYRVNTAEYKANDKVNLQVSTKQDGTKKYLITGQTKRQGLIILFFLFVITVTIVGKLRGFMSIIGMIFSFLVIIKMIIPMLIKGYDPLLSAILGMVLIIPVTFYISHGFNKKTHIGIITTIIGLLFTGLLAIFFTKLTHLTGFSSDETNYLQMQSNLNIKAIMLTGIMIGVLGVLDDITIGQASVVQQIVIANPKITLSKLYKRSMSVGQDHITSMVNTLILVYAGSALPLLLVFTNNNVSIKDIIEFEFIAEEIVKMLVGSIGLILMAPIATFLSAVSFLKVKSLHDHPVDN